MLSLAHIVGKVCIAFTKGKTSSLLSLYSRELDPDETLGRSSLFCFTVHPLRNSLQTPLKEAGKARSIYLHSLNLQNGICPMTEL